VPILPRRIFACVAWYNCTEEQAYKNLLIQLEKEAKQHGETLKKIYKEGPAESSLEDLFAAVLLNRLSQHKLNMELRHLR
jgi:hypothetical protein